jgi:hypothetical protein
MVGVSLSEWSSVVVVVVVVERGAGHGGMRTPAPVVLGAGVRAC